MPGGGRAGAAGYHRGVKLLRRRPKSFDIQVQDMTLHITAPDDLAEESRAAALSFWEQLECEFQAGCEKSVGHTLVTTPPQVIDRKVPEGGLEPPRY